MSCRRPHRSCKDADRLTGLAPRWRVTPADVPPLPVTTAIGLRYVAISAVRTAAASERNSAEETSKTPPTRSPLFGPTDQLEMEDIPYAEHAL